mgnify:CR=1 FL=1
MVVDTQHEIRPSSTAVVLRDTPSGLEVLLLRRHQQLQVGGGHWVFPGGTVDPDDVVDAKGDRMTAFHLAAVRETEEEAQIKLDQDGLQLIAWWTTPPSIKRRYETAFFIADCPGQQVVVDGEEADDYLWSPPGELLRAHRRGELALMPPTLVTLTELADCATVAQARAFYARRPVPNIHPRIADANGVVCMLYGGDAGYDSSDPGVNGARNRCYLEDGSWRYEFVAP